MSWFLCPLFPLSLFPCLLRLADHDFGGFDERERLVARLEGQLAHGVGGDDGGETLLPDGKDYLGEEAFNGDLQDGAGELIAAADARRAGLGSGLGKEFVEGVDGNAVMTAGCLDGADAPGEDPVLEGRVADAKPQRGLPRCKQGGSIHMFGSPKRGTLHLHTPCATSGR